ncbi:TonB-dependent receptor domain-containing protein [Rufibacter roseus]|uniref:TonB-dependent receptor domain-containing protein n=1 Tax=Rufibacter roseus TaxID=1567108 RepID=A0ABW2DPS2_9BACT|nr:outer membrane beta-barrel family protein [Rufibacter roseus]
MFKALLAVPVLLLASVVNLMAQAPAPVSTIIATPATASGSSVTSQKGTGKIAGVVTDSATSKPVEFATISLVNTATGKPVDGTITDNRGRFTLNKVDYGTFFLNVSFIGYEPQATKKFTLSEKNDDVEMGNIVLKPIQNKLAEVTVVGEKPLVEDKVDRMVYNADQDITNIGGNAADVLKKVPSLTVDLDGNVQLRGSANVRVLINNKPSSIVANSVADALRQIPSDMIKTVEVITSPSAKYDAEGTAGIINIITKKNTMYGVNGNVSASAGNRNANGNANVNVRRGKVGMNASFGTHQQYNNKNENELHRITRTAPDAEILSMLDQKGEFDRRGGGMYGQLGFDADLDSSNTINAGVNVYQGQWHNKGLQHSSLRDANGPRIIENDIRSLSEHASVDLNMGYTHIFKPQQELAVLAQWTRGGMNSTSDQDIFLNENYTLDTLLRNSNDGYNREMTFQVDYMHPFQNKTQLEIGTKAILRYAESDAMYRRYRLSTNEEDLEPNEFSYDQDVYAAYASYGFKLLKNYNVKSGARYEYTHINGNYIQPYQTPFTDDYANFIPNILVSRTFKTQTFRVGYTQRIQRPQIWYLNPYVNIIDAKNVSYGNPELEPELSHSYELGYSNYFKTSSVNVSLYWRQTNNSIEPFRGIVTEEEAARADAAPWQTTGVSYTTYLNIGKNATYGISISGNTKPVPKWSIGGSFNANYITLSSSTLQRNSAMQYSINGNTGYDFGKDLALQFFGSYSSPRPSIQGKFSGWYYSSISVRKQFWDKKASLSLGVDNPFSKTIKFTSELESATFLQNSLNQNYNRNIRISFSYRFGKMEMNQQPRRKRSIRNDDAKGGGEGN